MGLFRRSDSDTPPSRDDVARRPGVWNAQAGIWSDSQGRPAIRCLQLALVVAVVAALIGLIVFLIVVAVKNGRVRAPETPALKQKGPSHPAATHVVERVRASDARVQKSGYR